MLIIPHMMANWGRVFVAFFESLFEGSFRFADVAGFTVVACQLVYHATFVLGIVFVFRCH